jgi:hypothetical protein
MALNENVPSVPGKPSLLEWLESFLPFQFPRIPLPQVARNLDAAASRLLVASSENAAARFERSTAKVHAGTKAIEALGSRGAKLIRHEADDELDTRALDFVTQNARIEQRNRERIVELAAEELSRDAPKADATEPIDADWLNLFARIAAEKSDAEVQSLWGRILAGEIRRPGTTRLRTLARLATFDKHDAETAYRVMQYVLGEAHVLLKFMDTPSHYDLLLAAQELELLGQASSFGLDCTDEQDVIHLTYQNKVIVVRSGEKVRNADIDCYPLTAFGQDLLKLAGRLEGDDEYLMTCAQEIKKRGLSVLIGDAANTKEGDIAVNMREV